MENTNIKQNKKKAVIMAVLFMICLCASFISIPSYATSDNSLNFDAQPISSDASNPTPLINYNGEGNNGMFYAYANDPEIDVYAFGIRNSGNNNIGSIKFASQSQTTVSIYAITYSTGEAQTPSTVSVNYLDNTSQLYTNRTVVGGGSANLTSSSYLIPFYENVDNGFADVNDRIENPPITQISYKLQFTMPAGTIAFIDIENDDFNSVFMTVDSNFAHKTPFTGNQAIGYANAMPSSNFTLPYPNTTAIQWNGYGGKTLLGMYKSWSYRKSVNDSNGKYLVIVNPLVAIDSSDDVDNNNPISVSVDQVNSYKVFSLSGGWSDGSISYSSDGQSWSGTYDPDTNTWSVIDDVTGSPGTPSSGNIGVTQNSVHNWLETISKQIGSFFTGAIGAVTNLVGAGSEFIGKLGALYSWLPPAVYSVLTSALILVITIGVIKVFI